jgi:hypothetical protein
MTTHVRKMLHELSQIFVQHIPITKITENKIIHTPMLSHVTEPIQSWCRQPSHWKQTLHYTIQIEDVLIDIFWFIHTHFNVDIMMKQVARWLQFIMRQTIPCCKKNFRLFLYLTPFEKYMPSDPHGTLQQFNANTGMTVPCDGKCNTNHYDIVVYRYEEWFKVMIHETLHLLGLDQKINKKWSREKNMAVNSKLDIEISDFLTSITGFRQSLHHNEMGLYEAYVETWANIMNIMMYTVEHSEPKHYESFFKHELKQEQEFSAIQKDNILYALQHGMKINPDVKVYSYYIFKERLLANALKFISLCFQKNGSKHPIRKEGFDYDILKEILAESMGNQNYKTGIKRNNSKSMRMTRKKN